MNIFFTNWDPELAAAEQCDQYVIKIAIEVALFLSAIHWRFGYDGPIGTDQVISFLVKQDGSRQLLPARGPYRNSRIVKPSSEIYEWLVKSLSNYRWAVRYGLELVRQYTLRYGKIHQTEPVLMWLTEHEPPLPDIGLTSDVGLAMPAEFKNRKNPVLSYKDYIVCKKSRFARWKFTKPPLWYRQKLKNFDEMCDKYAAKAAALSAADTSCLIIP